MKILKTIATIAINIISIIALNAQAWQMEVVANEKIGIGASSESSYGGIFLCRNKAKPDLVIAGNPSIDFGDDCVLAADPSFISSDLFLQANDDITLEFDKNDNAEPAKFEIKTGAGNIVYQLMNDGFATLTGNQSVMEMKSVNHVNGSVMVLRNDSPTLFNSFGAINFQSAISTPGQIAYSSSQTMDFRVNNINTFMQLSDGTNHILMSNGAKLTSGGMWTDVSSKTKKNLEKKINSQNILAALTQLPIYQWRYKTEPQSLHIGPTAEDFYAMFNLGSDDQSLSPSDLAATAIASVQALHGENITLKNEIEALKKDVAILKDAMYQNANRGKRKRKNQ